MGSIPTEITRWFPTLIEHWKHLDRHFVESPLPMNKWRPTISTFAFEAQLAVQLTFNQKDAGSRPAGSTHYNIIKG